MPFQNPQISPPYVIDPGSCQAARIAAILDKPNNRVEVTPEWRKLHPEKKQST
jgi:hypothetical protein